MTSWSVSSAPAYDSLFGERDACFLCNLFYPTLVSFQSLFHRGVFTTKFLKLRHERINSLHDTSQYIFYMFKSNFNRSDFFMILHDEILDAVKTLVGASEGILNVFLGRKDGLQLFDICVRQHTF